MQTENEVIIMPTKINVYYFENCVTGICDHIAISLHGEVSRRNEYYISWNSNGLGISAHPYHGASHTVSFTSPEDVEELKRRILSGPYGLREGEDASFCSAFFRRNPKYYNFFINNCAHVTEFILSHCIPEFQRSSDFGLLAITTYWKLISCLQKKYLAAIASVLNDNEKSLGTRFSEILKYRSEICLLENIDRKKRFGSMLFEDSIYHYKKESALLKAVIDNDSNVTWRIKFNDFYERYVDSDCNCFSSGFLEEVNVLFPEKIRELYDLLNEFYQVNPRGGADAEKQCLDTIFDYLCECDNLQVYQEEAKQFVQTYTDTLSSSIISAAIKRKIIEIVAVGDEQVQQELERNFFAVEISNPLVSS